MTRVKQARLMLILETIHIPLWLIKDICWLMSYRLLGVMVAFPTILVAIIIAYMSYKDKDRFLPNVSIAFWITANANWMIAEFYELGSKSYSIYPFIAGILVFVVFLIQKVVNTDKIKHI